MDLQPVIAFCEKLIFLYIKWPKSSWTSSFQLELIIIHCRLGSRSWSGSLENGFWNKQCNQYHIPSNEFFICRIRHTWMYTVHVVRFSRLSQHDVLPTVHTCKSRISCELSHSDPLCLITITKYHCYMFKTTILIAEHRQPKGPPSGAPYPYRKPKGNLWIQGSKLRPIWSPMRLTFSPWWLKFLFNRQFGDLNFVWFKSTIKH